MADCKVCNTAHSIRRIVYACSRDELRSCPLFPTSLLSLFLLTHSVFLSTLPQLISCLLLFHLLISPLYMPCSHLVIHYIFPLSLSFSTSFLLSLSHPPAEPSRPHGGPDGRGHGEESEPSDDEMLSLSSQRSSGSTVPQRPEPPAPTPATPAPAEEVDLLGLDGGMNAPCPSSQPPSTAAATTDLLGDLFGAPPQPTSGASSTQSTPHKVAPNTASPCPSPAPTGEISLKVN